MLSQHEHRFAPFLVELFEQNQRPLVEAEAALFVAVDDVQRVLPPVGADVVLLEGDWENLVARIVDADAEGLEDFDLRVRRPLRRGRRRVGHECRAAAQSAVAGEC